MAWFDNVDTVDRPTSEGGGSKRRRWIGALVALVVVFAAAGYFVARALSSSSPTTAATSPSTTFPRSSGGLGTNNPNGFARSGSTGTVQAKAASGASFTMVTNSGQTVTVDVTASTTYRSTTGTASFSTISIGARVVVRGAPSGSTIKAVSVLIAPKGFGGFGGPGGFGSGGAPGIFGTVASVNKASDRFSVTTNSGSTTTVQVSSATTFRELAGSNAGSANFSSVVVGSDVLVTGTADSSGVVDATAVRIVPAGGFGGRGFGGRGAGGRTGNVGATFGA